MQNTNMNSESVFATESLKWQAPVVETIAVWENTFAANDSASDGPLCPGMMGAADLCSVDPSS